MVHSTVRALSVVTVLSAVSGTVLLTHQQSGDTGTSPSPELAEGGRLASAVLVATPGRADALAVDAPAVAGTVTAANPKQLIIETQAQRAAQQRSAQLAQLAQQRSRRELKLKLEAKIKARARAASAARIAAARAATAARTVALARASRSASRDPRAAARLLLAQRGWGAGQFSCLSSLWNRESGWNYRASNPSSGAYGIPQALPGSKMASAGSDWRTNPVTQIRWGLDYIADRYGTPCGAWAHSRATGWY